MSLRSRPEIETIAECAHGGVDETEMRSLGLSARDIVDFSVCCNPYGAPPAVGSAISLAAIGKYPDSDCCELRLQLSKRIGVPPDLIVVGNGSMELLRNAGLAFINPGDLCMIGSPTFGEYQVTCQIMGGKILEFPTAESESFRVDASMMAETVGRQRPKIVFLCNPNNPTGSYLERSEVIEIVNSSKDTLFVLDEAYAGFLENSGESTEMVGMGNVLVVRSMTKDYAMAGLRLGFAFAAKDIIAPMRKVRTPWSVNSVAQVAGTRALESGAGHLRESLNKIALAKKELLADLAAIGAPPIPSQANFFMVKVGDARALRGRLAAKGILVRDCTSFGLPQFIRIGVRTPEENDRLVLAMKEVLGR